MKKLTTIAALLKRVRRKPELAACAMALLFLAAASVPAKAQGTNTYGGLTVVQGGTLGLVAGQRVSVSVPNTVLLDGSVRYVKHKIKVYVCPSDPATERESNLVYSGESGGLNEAAHEFGHVFTFRHEHLRVSGEPVTGRVQLWIEIESFLSSTTPTEERSADVLLPTFELIDDGTGKTILIGHLLPAIQKVTDKDGR